MKLADNKTCTGCGACASICPNKSITMEMDSEGFYYPVIDYKKCVECGACKNVCHAFFEHKEIFNTSEFYAAWTKNHKDRVDASSGGLFGEISNWVLKNGGVVFGAAFSDDYKSLLHQSTDELDLNRLKKSKYFESHMNLTVKHIKQELDKGRWALFCGTPCQAMGVRSVFKNKYDRLIIVDFLCYGVPSQKAYQKYIAELEEKYKSRVREVSFRSKKLGWKTYCMYITFENGKKYFKLSGEDPFYRLFFSNISMRDTCYTCDRVNKSEADITLGDFWGVTEIKDFVDTDEGISLISIHNSVGKKILDIIKENLEITQISKENVAYTIKPKASFNKKSIDFENFKFFDNTILPKVSFVKYIKCRLMKSKFVRKLLYKK